MKKYHKDLVVTAVDLDALQHVNNVRYLEWVQEVSKEHWEELALPGWDDKYLWVVKSHAITYHRPALEGMVLRLSTSVPEARGALCRRVVEVEEKNTGLRIADCTTEWVLLDRNGGRPIRMPEEVRLAFI
jgi:acyl-CoA thioester hydrolase